MLAEGTPPLPEPDPEPEPELSPGAGPGPEPEPDDPQLYERARPLPGDAHPARAHGVPAPRGLSEAAPARAGMSQARHAAELAREINFERRLRLKIKGGEVSMWAWMRGKKLK